MQMFVDFLDIANKIFITDQINFDPVILTPGTFLKGYFWIMACFVSASYSVLWENRLKVWNVSVFNLISYTL